MAKISGKEKKFWVGAEIVINDPDYEDYRWNGVHGRIIEILKDPENNGRPACLLYYHDGPVAGTTETKVGWFLDDQYVHLVEEQEFTALTLKWTKFFEGD
jgi:hypothetical protein